MELRRPSHPTVVAYLALFTALGGGAIAASDLGKNAVGPKQLKRNAVTTAKIKNGAVTGAKIRAGTITGAKVDVSTLGTVPSAQTANSAVVADSIAASEPWHVVNAPGEPAFQNGWENVQTKAPPEPEPVAFYRDREGVVHLRGLAAGTLLEAVIFQLPPGYRPAPNRFFTPGDGLVRIYGSGIGNPGFDGAVVAPVNKIVSFDGITFRAES
jgi:hypothetical protein